MAVLSRTHKHWRTSLKKNVRMQVVRAYGSFVLRRVITNPNQENHPARGCISHRIIRAKVGVESNCPRRPVVPSEGQAVWPVVLRQPPMYSRRNDVTLTWSIVHSIRLLSLPHPDRSRPGPPTYLPTGLTLFEQRLTDTQCLPNACPTCS